MKLYLSSYKLGEQTELLKEWLAGTQKRVGYIPNAFDFTSWSDPANRAKHMEFDMNELKGLGFQMELLDLKDYFGKTAELKAKLAELDMLWVSGGNTFVLRQAMRLSGFDQLLGALSAREDFVYGGYSAGCCVLSPTLKGLQIVDDPNDFPYEGCKETIWEGLGLIDYAFLPHYDSDHPESADIDKEVAYCTEQGIPFKTVRDGEVIVVENSNFAG
jgi:dipeptidase E